MSNRHLMGRRQFLFVSSAAAVMTATAGPKLFAGSLSPSARRLAVGYIPFGDTAVIDAARIPAADGGFISRGARIMAVGAAGAPSDPRGRRAIGLVTHYSYLDGAERKSVPFRAWGSSRLTGAEGPAVAFTVPVDEVQKISFVVETESGAPSAGSSRRDAIFAEVTRQLEHPMTLSLQNDQASHKLARGYYVIVPIFENDSEPQWREWSLGKAGVRASLVDRDGAAAPFEHFLLRVDYAAK
jgi:hypothetical protein